MALVKKIVAGGQTGVDTAALRLAVSLGIPHGGWCPRGRKREDGVISRRFHLQETPSRGYKQRTAWNVRDSDGSIIFSITARLKGGSRDTARFARRQGKPWLHIAAQQSGIDHVAALRRFIRKHKIRVLNVAGPRKSQEPTAGRLAAKTLRKLLMRSGTVKRHFPAR